MSKYAALKTTPTPTWSIFDLVGAVLVAPVFQAIEVVDDFIISQRSLTRRPQTRAATPIQATRPLPRMAIKRRPALKLG